jgi:MFS family permease
MVRRAVVIGAAVTAAIAFLVIVAFIPSDASLSAIYVCVALFGGTIIPTYSIVIAHVNDGVTPGEFVAASGGLLIVQGVGATVGPTVDYHHHGPAFDCTMGRLPVLVPAGFAQRIKGGLRHRAACACPR